MVSEMDEKYGKSSASLSNKPDIHDFREMAELLASLLDTVESDDRHEISHFELPLRHYKLHDALESVDTTDRRSDLPANVPTIERSSLVNWLEASSGRRALILVRHTRYTVPIQLSYLADDLSASRNRFIVFSEEGEQRVAILRIWDMSVRLVARAASVYWGSDRSEMPPSPFINRGPDDTVEVLWKSGSRSFVANFGPDVVDDIAFVGFDHGDPRFGIEGNINPDLANGWLLQWLME